MTDELTFARRVAHEAGEIVRDYFGRPLAVEEKGWADPVTAADRAAEAHIRAAIDRDWPGDAVYGEEEGAAAGATGRTWLIDPLDGTANFAGGLPTFAVVITLLGADGQPLLNVTHDPVRAETFEAVRGGGARLNDAPVRVGGDAELALTLVHLAFPRMRDLWECSLDLTRRVTAATPHARNVGSSALAQAYVACGRLHAHARVSVGEFDIVGGNLMIEEAGGVVTDLGGGPFADGARGLLAAGPQIHAKLLRLELIKALPC
ncbi:MAG TPA: inositol monophosphatase [Chloroflexota bacterium]|nr:inositol monophosphatase [Chloroflexota bacterium]